jgi:hypothetical protein
MDIIDDVLSNEPFFRLIGTIPGVWDFWAPYILVS